MDSNKLIIFDCDGVVVDSEPIALNAIKESLNFYNIDVTFDICKDAFLGKSFGCGMLTLHSLYNSELSVLPIDFEQKTKIKIDSELKKRLKPIKNIHTALKEIKNKKCIASGSDYRRLDISLTVTKTKDYFDNIFSATSVSKGKPSPDIFLFAAYQMGYKPENCIVIEDSQSGMFAALNAGIKVYIYAPKGKPNFIVPKNAEIFTDMIHLPSIISNYSNTLW